MAESSDPVLFTRRAQRGTGAAAVDGVCMVSRSRVRWQPNDPSKGQPATLDVAAITRTQQAPGKPFIKLDAASGALVLGFESVADRDEAVDLLKQLKPPAAAPQQASGAASAAPGSGGIGAPPGVLLPTAKQRAALFQADPDLKQLHQSLVEAGILGEAEFWGARQELVRGGGGGGARLRQRAGLPSAMLADVKPSADGQTEKVHFQLTPQIIQQIFTERPEVHRAYLAHVPHTLDEKAFWTRYFKQQYKKMARRRRQGLPVDGRHDDDDDDELFLPFKKQLQEQERERAQAAMSRVDPTVNMAADAGEHFSAAAYGSLHDGTRDPQAALRASHVDSIARDINRHAAVVLRGAPEGLAGLEAAPSGADAGADNTPQHANTGKIAAALAAQQKAAAKAAAAGGGSSGDEALSADRMEEWQQRAASALDDLRLDDPESRYLPLNIQDPRAYFDAAAAAGMAGSGEAGGGAGGRTAAAADLRRALAAVRPAALPSPPCDPQLAGAVLLELSQDQDASLVEEFGPVAASALQYPPQDRARGLPPVLLEHLRGEALKTNELLRHFWGCVPLTSAARAARAAKLGRALQEQRKLLQGHLQHPMGEGSSHQVHVAMMLRPLVAAVDAALARHGTEQQQRRKQAPP
ncbi:putative RNA polymerase II transcription factor B subunit 1-1 [Micractinium conductrix]|uniref:RNA polymerase II transcription factor B subunit 1-1 n=1 Tax=Micractinium conductrix TaxID=554055 RepID=A0A2P6VEB6_9CHLO|nr:putative RNA polymerase II transcription factor B subunit 1-1 [Micractinium conductrix]|eukprot:PSC72434.1 putative RNA polymerase II transcription factor B subunit 1-1 [Micractinium conductrix]